LAGLVTGKRARGTSNNEMPASSTNIGMLLHRQRDEPNQVQEQQFLATSAKTAKLYMDKW
jgi:hypothetical protein